MNKDIFKLKNLVILIGLGGLGCAHASLNAIEMHSEGTLTLPPIYGNIQHVLVIGNSPATTVYYANYFVGNADLGANVLNLSNFNNELFFPKAVHVQGSFTVTADYTSIQQMAIQSIYGINYLSNIETSEHDNFAYYQYSFQNPTSSNKGLTIGTQNGNNLISQPKIKAIQELEPADSNDGNVPIYRIVIQSGYGTQDSTANSTIASAYYFNAYNDSPFDSTSIGGSVVEPLSVQPDSQDSGDYGLSDAVVYYHGALKNIYLGQNINYLPQKGTYSSDIYSGSDSENLNNAALPAPPSGTSEPNSAEASTFSISLQPLNRASSTMAEPIYANGMNQAPFTVTIYDGNGAPIATNDAKYGWLYNLIYFVDSDTNSIITNLQNNFGAEAVTMYPGSYTRAISNQGDANSLLQNSNNSSGSAANDYYYSSTLAGNHNIIAKLEIPTSDGNPYPINSSPLTFQVENNSAVEGVSAAFPTANNTNKGTVVLSNSVVSASTSNPATYLNMLNPVHPIYVGFVRYANVSAYNYYASKGTGKGYTLNINGADISVTEGLGLSLSFDYQDLGENATYPTSIAIDAVDTYGNLYQTAGFGD